MKKYLTLIILIIGLKAYPTYNPNPNKVDQEIVISNLLLSCDLVMIANSDSFWSQEDKNTEVAKFKVKEIIASKLPNDDVMSHIVDGEFSIHRDVDLDINNFVLFPNVDYLFFIKISEKNQMESRKYGEVRVLNNGWFIMADTKNIPVLKNTIMDENKLDEFVKKFDARTLEKFGVLESDKFLNIVTNLVSVMSTNSDDVDDSLDDDLYRSNLKYLLKYGPYKKFINFDSENDSNKSNTIPKD